MTASVNINNQAAKSRSDQSRAQSGMAFANFLDKLAILGVSRHKGKSTDRQQNRTRFTKQASLNSDARIREQYYVKQQQSYASTQDPVNKGLIEIATS